MFSRASMFLLDLLIFAAGWYYCYFKMTTNFKQEQYRTMLLSLPGTILMYFGCYSLFSIGNGLYVLKDCPEEFEQLQVDIKRAREQLAQKGFKTIE